MTFDELGGIRKIVQIHLLESLIIKLNNKLILKANQSALEVDILTLKFKFHNIRDFVHGLLYIDAMDVLRQFALLKLRQGQEVFDVKQHHLA